MADQCSICLEALDGGVAALACGHRFHAACLAQCAAAVGTAATTSRRGTLTACPNCRTTSRVAPAATSAAFSVGDRVLALWGHKWFPGDVYAVKDGGSAYEIAWDDEDSSNEVPASRVRAAPVTVDVDAPAAREARPAVVVTPRVTPSAAPPVAPPAPPASVPRQAPIIIPLARSASKPKTSRFTGVRRHQDNWRAEISVRGTKVNLGAFDVEEDAARAYDAALIKYRNAPTVNFPGEAPLASVLAALPVAPPVEPPVPTAPPRRSGRAPAPRVIVDPEAPNIRDQRDRTRRAAPAKQHAPPRDAAKTISSSVCTVAVTPVMAPDTSSATRFSASGSGDLRVQPAAPAPRASDPPPAPRADGAVVTRLRSRAPPAPASSAPGPHVASMASAWVAVCTDLLEAARRPNMRGLREPLTSRGFICGADRENGINFHVRVPPDFPCYYDVVGKDYVKGRSSHAGATSLVQLRNYLDGALTLARTGGAFRTDAEYKPRPVKRGRPPRQSLHVPRPPTSRRLA